MVHIGTSVPFPVQGGVPDIFPEATLTSNCFECSQGDNDNAPGTKGTRLLRNGCMILLCSKSCAVFITAGARAMSK